jgi:hypothetical protein
MDVETEKYMGITFINLNNILNDEYSCTRCGAMTNNPDKHAQWHQRLNDALRTQVSPLTHYPFISEQL